jgi:hypothetical protein
MLRPGMPEKNRPGKTREKVELVSGDVGVVVQSVHGNAGPFRIACDRACARKKKGRAVVHEYKQRKRPSEPGSLDRAA